MKKLGLIMLSFVLIIFTFASVNPGDQPLVQQPDSNSAHNIPESDVIVLKLAHNYEIPDPNYMAITQKFIPMIAEGSNWKIRVEEYGDNILGTEAQFIQGVKNGTIEMCIGGQGLSEIVPRVQILNVPYLFDTYAEIRSVLNGSYGSSIMEDLNKLGIVGLAWGLNGFRQISINRNSRRNEWESERPEIATTFSDLSKLAIDSMGYGTIMTNPEQVNILLNQGIVAGQDFPIVKSYNNGWYNNLEKLYLTKHSINPTLFMINEKVWNELSYEHRLLIQNAASAAMEYEISLMASTESDIIETLKKWGVEIIIPDLSQDKSISIEKFSEWIKRNPQIESMYTEFLNAL